MNTGQEEPAALDREGEPAPSRVRPPRSPAPGGADDEAGFVWRSLLHAVDMLAGVAGLHDDDTPDLEVEYGLDAYSDIDAYREWLHDKARVEAGTWVWTGCADEPTPGAPGAGWDPDGLGVPGDGASSPDTAAAGAPTISVVVPIFRPELWYLQQCVESVKRQEYGKWELCLCDDASGDVEVDRFLKRAAASDPRIKVAVHDSNGGISRASNTALALATGEFVALLDHDDELTPDALLQVARRALDEPEADVIYSDEDKLDQAGQRGFPNFKPDWSPDLLLSYPYLGHLTVVRRAVIEEIGGFRPEMDGSQDFDLMLRATERARAVAHIPRVLYHWRVVQGSAAGDPGAKPWAYDASRRALADALVRRGLDGHVEPGPFLGAYHTRRAVRSTPTVSIIIPFRDQAAMLRTCVDSLGADSGLGSFEVVLVDNDSVEPETHAVVDALLEQPRVRLLEHPGPFNWSAINNAAARTCDADMLLFLNDDVVANGGFWMRALIEQAQRPDVGAVGCRLLYPDGTVQHSGVILGMHGLAGNLMSGMPGAYAGYMGWSGVVKEFSAVSAACMMSRRQVFEELDGFDEDFAFEFGDIDYCLRLRHAGYRVVFTPHAELVHHESHTKGTSGSYHDGRTFLRKWISDIRRGDPFYNENLSRLESNCAIRPVEEDRRWEKLLSGLASSSNK
jgi:GT2 family glycosyltransferase